MSYRLSVLDQSPIAAGSTAADALRNTLDLAHTADSLGYHRYWLAEHHASRSLAGVAPEALIGPVALATSHIRVGSGGVMLPHYSPFKVAETFAILSALAPGRIDLGLGRAPGSDQRTDADPLADERQRSHRAATQPAERRADLPAQRAQPRAAVGTMLALEERGAVHDCTPGKRTASSFTRPKPAGAVVFW